MDIERLLYDYNVPFVTGGHKHARQGWMNTACPHCVGSGQSGYHLGWNLNEGYWSCYRCGWHSPVKTISKLIGLSIPRTQEVIQDYGTAVYKRIERKGKKEFILPTFTRALTDDHKKYLRSRGFNPDKIEKHWKVQSTHNLSKIDNIKYPYRILIPYFWNGEMVSFDARDTTGKQGNKYQACPKERELVEHKKILYGNQEAWEDTGIIVEGTTDVWAIGKYGACTSGIQFTHKQAQIIGTSFKKVAIWFDSEPQAQEQARKLISILQGTFNIDAFNVTSKKDPAAMPRDEVKKMVKNIMNK